EADNRTIPFRDGAGDPCNRTPNSGKKVLPGPGSERAFMIGPSGLPDAGPEGTPTEVPRRHLVGQEEHLHTGAGNPRLTWHFTPIGTARQDAAAIARSGTISAPHRSSRPPSAFSGIMTCSPMQPARNKRFDFSPEWNTR